MSNVDKLVETWFLGRWTGFNNPGNWVRMTPSYSPVEHGEPNELKVISCDGSWECGCYSEWTRDDRLEFIFHVLGKGGSIKVTVEGYGMPEVISELIEMSNSIEDVCSIEAQEYGESQDR